MGTSRSGTGPGSGIPLVPPWGSRSSSSHRGQTILAPLVPDAADQSPLPAPASSTTSRRRRCSSSYSRRARPAAPAPTASPNSSPCTARPVPRRPHSPGKLRPHRLFPRHAARNRPLRPQGLRGRPFRHPPHGWHRPLRGYPLWHSGSRCRRTTRDARQPVRSHHPVRPVGHRSYGRARGGRAPHRRHTGRRRLQGRSSRRHVRTAQPLP